MGRVPLLTLMILLTSVAVPLSAMSIPHIFVQGSHFEVAKEVGSTFKSRIQEFYQKHPLLYSKFLPWSKTAGGKQVLNEYYSVIKRDYPQYLLELQGLAEGAEVPFEQVLMICLNKEIAVIIDEISHQPTQCSDVYVNTNQYMSIAHNEDTLPLAKNLSYFVTAHITESTDFPTTKIKTKEERFTVFCYPGVLGGNAFGYNHHGLVFTVNALYPKLLGRNKTGRYILTRAALSASSVEQVKTIMVDEGTGVSTGFSINIGVLPKIEDKNKSIPQIWNLEVAPTNTTNSKVDLYQLKSGEVNYFHVNKYRRIEIEELSDKIKSSLARTRRIEQLLPAPENGQLLSILGDTENDKYPIYRTPRPTDAGCTVATGLFDLLQRRLSVYEDNPKTSEPVATFDLDY